MFSAGNHLDPKMLPINTEDIASKGSLFSGG